MGFFFFLFFIGVKGFFLMRTLLKCNSDGTEEMEMERLLVCGGDDGRRKHRKRTVALLSIIVITNVEARTRYINDDRLENAAYVSFRENVNEQRNKLNKNYSPIATVVHAYTISHGVHVHMRVTRLSREPRSAVTLEIRRKHNMKNPIFPATRENIWIFVDAFSNAESLRPFFPFTSETKCRRTLVRTLFPPSAVK